MPIKRLLTCLSCILGFHMASAEAGLIVLDPVDSGLIRYERTIYFEQPGFPPPPPPKQAYGHGPSLDEIEIEWFSHLGCLCNFLLLENGYIVFDLSGIGNSVTSASLEFNLNMYGDLDLLTVNTVDTITPEALALLPTGGVGGLPLPLGEQLLDDMGSGTQLGSLDITGGNGNYNANLNTAAIDLINTTGGLLAFGIDHPTYALDSQLKIDFGNGPRLILDDGTSVALPGTLWLSLTATLLCLPNMRLRSARRR